MTTLVNHEKKIIYIRIPKTASSYLTKILQEYYGFIYTQEFNEKYVNYNTNDLFWCTKNINCIDYAKTSENINKILGMDEDKWNTYKKFTFVRNPYDRAVSGYSFIQKLRKNMDSFNINNYKNCSFKEMIKYNLDEVLLIEYAHLFMPQSANNIVFDKIGKFENLETDLKNILISYGFKPNEIIHKIEEINTSEHNNYKNYYDNESLSIINKMFKIDFENFNYKMIFDIKDF